MPLPTIPSGNVASALPSGYDVANSCRFNSADSAYMHKTPSGAGSTRKLSFSCWFKLTELAATRGGAYNVFHSVTDGLNRWVISIDDSDKLFIGHYNGSSWNMLLNSNQLLRDISAFYNLIVIIDTEEGTDTNRAKVFLNGTQITSWSTATYPAEDYDGIWCKNSTTEVGRYAPASAQYGGFYLAEVVLCDGQTYTNTDFGEFDEDSPTIWKPKDVSGLTFGTNGFYLDFEDSSNLGNDANGGTDLTEVNLAATDQATDTPTNNFATFNSLSKNDSGTVTFSEGNCKIVSDASNPMTGAGVGTFGLTAGKWYYEVKIASLVGNHTHGAVSELTTELYTNVGALQNDTGVTSWINGDGGEVVVDGTATTADYGLYTDGQIMGVALDIDNYNITYLRNGSALVSDFNMSTTRGTIFPLIKTGVNTTSEVNFGGCSAFTISSAQSDANGYGNFEHAPPSGYLALCTKNLGSDGG